MDNLAISLEEILKKQRQTIVEGDIEELSRLTEKTHDVLEKLKKNGGIKTKKQAEILSSELNKNIDILHFARNITSGLLQTMQAEKVLQKTGSVRKRV